MADLNKLVSSLSSGGVVSGLAGGLAGTALAGALTGKKGRKLAGSALKVGAVAAVGGLAYTAYKRYRNNTQAAGAGQEPASAAQSGPAAALPSAPAEQSWGDIDADRFAAAIENNGGAGGMLLLRAMIAAAYSDGHIDSDEQNRIFAEVDRMRLSSEEKALLFDELRNPLSMQELIKAVPSQEAAVEVYAASLVAIDETTSDGQLYLRSLASALSLPNDLVVSMYEQAELARMEGEKAA